MKYEAVITSKAKKQMLKIDRFDAIRLKKWIENNLINCTCPYFQGKMLKGNLSCYWLYGIGDYRIISLINESDLSICIINIGHRKNLYE